MSSIGGILFGVINIVGNFGTVFVDNAYWQRAIGKSHDFDFQTNYSGFSPLNSFPNICISLYDQLTIFQTFILSFLAAHPKYCVKAYLLGGMSWFAVPFTLATTLGLAGRALQIGTTPGDVSAGLVLPQVAVVLLGKGGGVMALLIVCKSHYYNWQKYFINETFLLYLIRHFYNK
jgi:hypothetical protein